MLEITLRTTDSVVMCAAPLKRYGRTDTFSQCPSGIDPGREKMEYSHATTWPISTNSTESPVTINLDLDPGEHFPHHDKHVMELINSYVEEHQRTMVPGWPSLDWCDHAVANWAPKGRTPNHRDACGKEVCPLKVHKIPKTFL
eukprot:sb/3474057/